MQRRAITPNFPPELVTGLPIQWYFIVTHSFALFANRPIRTTLINLMYLRNSRKHLRKDQMSGQIRLFGQSEFWPMHSTTGGSIGNASGQISVAYVDRHDDSLGLWCKDLQCLQVCGLSTEEIALGVLATKAFQDSRYRLV